MAANGTKQPSWDLIIIGAGMAGITAALAAREQNASVLLLDCANGGGSSAMSGGVVYSGGGTPQQKAAGVEDTPEDMFDYLKQEAGDAVSEATLRRFCNESVARLAWLEKYGAKFEGSLCPYKTGWPTDQYYLYYSGNEKAWPYKSEAKPAPRGHRQKAAGFSGRSLVTPLLKNALKEGAELVPACRVDRILMEDGRVKGVECRVLRGSGLAKHQRLKKWVSKYIMYMPDPGKKADDWANKILKKEAKPETFLAKSVIIATGSFSWNKDMRKENLSLYHEVGPLGAPDSDGSGIKMGQAVGGTVSHMERMSAWRFLAPPSAYLGGVAVSVSGERIAAEDLYGASFTEVMIRRFHGKGYLVVDSVQWAAVKKELPEQVGGMLKVPHHYTIMLGHKKSATLEGLCKAIGVDVSGLKKTVDAYNNAIATGADDPVHKSPEYRSPISKGPFYAVDISIKSGPTMPVLGLTLGGLRVSEDSGLVLDKESKVVEGLYAAGRCAVGVCSNSYVSGLALADCVFSGMRAGKHAAVQAHAAPSEEAKVVAEK